MSTRAERLQRASKLAATSAHCVQNPMPPQQIVDLQMLGLRYRNWSLNDAKHPIAAKHGEAVMNVVRTRVRQTKSRSATSDPGLQVFFAFLSRNKSLHQHLNAFLDAKCSALCDKAQRFKIVNTTTVGDRSKIVVKVKKGDCETLVEFYLRREPASSRLCGMWRTISMSIL